MGDALQQLQLPGDAPFEAREREPVDALERPVERLEGRAGGGDARRTR